MHTRDSEGQTEPLRPVEELEHEAMVDEERPSFRDLSQGDYDDNGVMVVPIVSHPAAGSTPTNMPLPAIVPDPDDDTTSHRQRLED